MQYVIAIIIDAKKALKGSVRVYCGIKYETPYNIPKFIAKLNIPNVKMLIGSAINLIIGLINMFTIVKLAAISMAYAKFSTLIPGR